MKLKHIFIINCKNRKIKTYLFCKTSRHRHEDWLWNVFIWQIHNSIIMPIHFYIWRDISISVVLKGKGGNKNAFHNFRSVRSVRVYVSFWFLREFSCFRVKVNTNGVSTTNWDWDYYEINKRESKDSIIVYVFTCMCKLGLWTRGVRKKLIRMGDISPPTILLQVSYLTQI